MELSKIATWYTHQKKNKNLHQKKININSEVIMLIQVRLVRVWRQGREGQMSIADLSAISRWSVSNKKIPRYANTSDSYVSGDRGGRVRCRRKGRLSADNRYQCILNHNYSWDTDSDEESH